jgi:hypothetical protein
MKITEADVIWTPIFDDQRLNGPNAGAVRVERRLSKLAAH